MTIALIGNPNCGKTALFNALTGSHQRVGNWPGVTVDKKEGVFQHQGTTYPIIDLPGIYSLCDEGESAIDAQIARTYLDTQSPTLIVNVIDATHLERNLYLTSQLLTRKQPMVVALNMMDLVKKSGTQIDIRALEKKLGCPVIPISANKQRSLSPLIKAITNKQPIPKTPDIKSYLETAHKHCDDAVVCLATARFQWVNNITTAIITKPRHKKRSLTERIDAIVLNRFLGFPIFLLMMYAMFFFAINIGGVFQDFFDIGSNTLLVTGLAHLLQSWHWPGWLVALLANGAGKGINTTITFIPVIGGMFLFLSFLENCGYMSRAAFVMDKLMQRFGLPGRAFVPMIIGFGCNVPAVMGARTLTHPRDRILTVMMMPFMSCGARLAIFAVFASAFFPQGGQNIIFLLYVTGIAVALFTGWLLRKTLLPGDASPLIMEMPCYHRPQLSAILKRTHNRLKQFLKRASRVIIPVCIIIGGLNAVTLSGHLTHHHTQHSALSRIGQFITPIFSPMGIQSNNWPATVGLATGVLAKEVVVGTLNTLYSQVGHLNETPNPHFSILAGLKTALHSIPDNLVALPQALTNPIKAAEAPHSIDHRVYGIMHQYFQNTSAVFAYLLFVLLYFPCVSTLAVMRRECGKRWANVSVFWSTAVAYGLAVISYQLGTLSHNPTQSVIAIGLTGVLFMLFCRSLPALKPWLNKTPPTASATPCRNCSSC